MSRRSPQTRPSSSHSISHSSPLVSVSTITYIASWRGQLLICTVVLVIGAIYFVVRQPISDYLRRRREEISRARQQELMSLESEKEAVETPTVEKEKLKDRGRDKKKDTKKRKGSLLKVANIGGSGTESSIAGPSSLESSPAPQRLGVPTPAKKTQVRNQSPSPSPLNTPISTPAQLPPSTPEQRRVSVNTPRIRLREPTSESKIEVTNDELDIEETPRSIKSVKHTKDWARTVSQLNAAQNRVRNGSVDRSGLSPEQIPLPDSPESSIAGSSRLRVPSEAGYFSDSTSNTSEHPSSSRSQTGQKSTGWSIMPDEGWLPLSALASAKKKKAKKGRQSHNEPLSALPPVQASPAQSPAAPPRRHVRQDSLQMMRPTNASSEEYEAHMDRMEGVIDRLRGELGASLASGRMAREAEEEARHNEQQIRKDLDQLRQRRRSSDKVRNREAELTDHLNQAQRHANNLMQRIAELEKRTPNKAGPPPSTYMLMGPPSPFPQMNGHNGFPGNMSPMVPGSPFAMSFPSPGIGGPSRNNVPHPSMYPSPLYHPNAHAILLNAANGNMNMLNANGHNQHQQNTSPFRRTSTSDISSDVFAGPLTPGIPPSTASPYPHELGHGFPPGPMPMGPMSANDENGQTRQSPLESMTREERRTSIEASVLRKKSGHLISPIEGQEGPESIAEEKEGEVIGLGMGEVLAPEHDNVSQTQEPQSRANGEEQEQSGIGEAGSESQHDELRSSLSPPQHFGLSNSNSGSNFTSNPPTPSPQSRLLTPSQLHHATLAEEIGSSRSSSSAYDVDTDKPRISRDESHTPLSAGFGDIAARPQSPASPLWVSDLNPGQLAQRKALAAKREQREAAAARRKSKGDKVVKVDHDGQVKDKMDAEGEGLDEITTKAGTVEI